MSSLNYVDSKDQYALCSMVHMKRSEYREYRPQLIVSQYGSSGHAGRPYPAQLHIFKADADISESSQVAPNFSLNLEMAQVYLIKPSPSPSPNRKFERSVSCTSLKISRSFCITTLEGVCYQFRTDNDYECQLWINMLKFMIIFPYSSIPPEPGCETSVFDRSLNPVLYQADSVWPAYVAVEEVGGRCDIAGMRTLALRGKVVGDQGKLELFSLVDDRNPVLSLKHGMIRCTGKMGRWLYIDVGTRCKGGPGLLWMYFGGKEKAVWMKEVFYTFLVKQQVPIQSTSPYNLFPLATSPPILPRPISAGDSLPKTYSPTTSPLSATEKFTPPPLPYRHSRSYEVLEPAVSTPTLQKEYHVLEVPKPDSERHCYETMDLTVASYKARCKNQDYQILESDAHSSNKQHRAGYKKK